MSQQYSPEIPLSGGHASGIQPQQQQPQNQGDPHMNASAVKLDPVTGSQLVSSIKGVSNPDALKIPSEHMAPDPSANVQDPSILPTYIPPSDLIDPNYIQAHNTQAALQNIADVSKSEESFQNSLDATYEKFQVPLILGLLFFLFQLPTFKKTNQEYFPLLFSDEGQYNIKGYAFTSILFSVAYYMINIIMAKF